MKKNQHERILDYMKCFGSITPMDAILDLGITKLSTRVGEMIRAGVPVVKKTETAKNRYGEPTHYTRYSLGG